MPKFLSNCSTARPQDMRPLDGPTLQLCGYELGLKRLEICGFWPKALQMQVLYAYFDQKPFKCADFLDWNQPYNSPFLRTKDWELPRLKKSGMKDIMDRDVRVKAFSHKPCCLEHIRTNYIHSCIHPCGQLWYCLIHLYLIFEKSSLKK